MRNVLPAAFMFVACLALGGVVSCSSSSSGDTGPTAQSLRQDIFEGSCAVSSSCHDGAGHQAGLDFSSLASTCTSLRAASCERPTMKRVAVGQPDQSYLYLKLTCSGFDCTSTLGAPDRSCTSALTNQRMPLNGTPLAPSKLESIQKWIADGMPGCP